jgi:hypothetical protein
MGGRRVVTDGNTKFTQGNCKHMSNGLEIGVSGTITTGGTLQATRVEMKNNLSAQFSSRDVWRRSRQASWGTLSVVPQWPHTQTSIAFTRVATVMRSARQTGQNGIPSLVSGAGGSTVCAIVEKLTVAVGRAVVTRGNPASAARKMLRASSGNTA